MMEFARVNLLDFWLIDDGFPNESVPWSRCSISARIDHKKSEQLRDHLLRDVSARMNY